MFANLSGYLTALLYGFTGIQPGPGEADTWAAHQVGLPEGWQAIQVDVSGSEERRTLSKLAPGSFAPPSPRPGLLTAFVQRATSAR